MVAAIVAVPPHDADLGALETENVAVLAPEGMVTVAGTVAYRVSLLCNDTVMPDEGAAFEISTLQVV